MTTLSQLRIIPGMSVRHDKTLCRVVDLLSDLQVLVEQKEGKRYSVAASELTPEITLAAMPVADLVTIDSLEWQGALDIYQAIRPLVALGKLKRTRSDVEKVAHLMHKHPATIFRWLKDYEESGLVSSLMRAKRGDAGKKRLDKKVENVITQCINDFYMKGQRRTITKTAYEIRKICLQSSLQPPNLSTVRKRINEISGEDKTRARHGAKAAEERYEPIRGQFPGADFPLAVVQIDHTPMDVIVVDELYRKPIGRPYLTTAIDVFSRMIVGFYVSLDPPGALATGECISRAILSKEVLLARLGIDDLPWPCFGVMRTIHTDNAREFRGTMLGKAAEQYGIIAERRPKGRPKFGGHVERQFRTHMHEIHNELPGTTFSNVAEKMEYDSEGKAVMTIPALEKWFTLFVLGVYHQKPHDGIDGLPPIVKWGQGIYGVGDAMGTGIPMRVPDEDRLRLDFMPYIERTVQEYGIQFMGITYYTDALRRLIHSTEPKSPTLARQFVCRYDPRDLSRVWLYEPDAKEYIEIPYRNLSRPPVSSWEVREASRLLREDSVKGTNEELIFKSIDRMRTVVEEEAAKTKSARRKQQRMKQWASAPKIKQASDNLPTNVKQLIEEPSDEDLTPFEGIRES